MDGIVRIERVGRVYRAHGRGLGAQTWVRGSIFPSTLNEFLSITQLRTLLSTYCPLPSSPPTFPSSIHSITSIHVRIEAQRPVCAATAAGRSHFSLFWAFWLLLALPQPQTVGMPCRHSPRLAVAVGPRSDLVVRIPESFEVHGFGCGRVLRRPGRQSMGVTPGTVQFFSYFEVRAPAGQLALQRTPGKPHQRINHTYYLNVDRCYEAVEARHGRNRQPRPKKYEAVGNVWGIVGFSGCSRAGMRPGLPRTPGLPF